MYSFQCAYRQSDGSLRAYIGYGHTANSAAADALIKIADDCQKHNEEIDFTMDGNRYHENTDRLTKTEIRYCQRQWRKIHAAAKKAGAAY